jgi:hypothetical protein
MFNAHIKSMYLYYKKQYPISYMELILSNYKRKDAINFIKNNIKNTYYQHTICIGF